MESKDDICPVCGSIIPPGSRECPVCGFKFNKPDRDSWPLVFASIFNRKRIYFTIGIFIVELIFMFFVSSIPMSHATAASLSNSSEPELDSIRNEPIFLRAVSIFSHNYEIATIEVIPVIGQIFFFISIYGTAVILDALAVMDSVTGPIALLSLLFLPYSWLELPSYAIAAAEGIFLISSLFRKTFKTELRRALFVWLLVGLELLLAGTFESWTIYLEVYNPSALLETWIPYIIILAAFIITIRTVLKRIQESSIRK